MELEKLEMDNNRRVLSKMEECEKIICFGGFLEEIHHGVHIWLVLGYSQIKRLEPAIKQDFNETML
ncbi:hypothetical protein KI387_014184, partial [Taxus chinensis]